MKIKRFNEIEIAEGEARLAQILNVLKKEGLTGQPPFGARLDKIEQDCVFRGDPPTASDLMRPPVPILSAH